MKNIKLFACPFVYVLFSIVFCLIGCEPLHKEKEPSSSFIPYITAYSGGVQSIEAPVIIEFAHSFPDVELNKPIQDELFVIEPNTRGKVIWKDNKTLHFIPDEKLTPNTTYSVSFNLGKLYDVDSSLRLFTYTFRTKLADGELKLKDYFQYDTNRDVCTVIYKLTLNDVLPSPLVKEAVQVISDLGQQLDFDIKPLNSVEYEIEVNEINCADKTNITISVDGSVIGLHRSLTKKLEIPHRDTFSIVECKRLDNSEKGIKLTFSEALDSQQNIDSYISLSLGANEIPFQSKIRANQLYLYINSDKIKNSDVLKVLVYSNTKSAYAKTLETNFSYSVQLGIQRPTVSFLGSGTILPNSTEQIVSFQAQGLQYVDLQVVQVYNSNVLGFLQDQNLSGTDNMRRSGRLILKKRIDLRELTAESLKECNRFDLDLSLLFQQDKGAIYHLALSFTPDCTLIPKFAGGSLESSTIGLTDNILDDQAWNNPSYYDYGLLKLGIPYDWKVYEWELRDDPNSLTFYMDESNVSTTTNVYSTNIGVIAKQNDSGKLWIATNDIITSRPMSNVAIKVYSYQLQVVASGQTDKNGFVEIEPTTSAKPFLVVAEYDQNRTIVKVLPGDQLSVSRFDVGGVVRSNGLKGFIYGERGVWRPGDTLHLCFVLEDRDKQIPSNHPVSLEIYNPHGQFYTRILAKHHENGVYYFKVNTKTDDPTGLWNAYVKLGGSSFHKALHIASIKPNRLKINLDFKKPILRSGSTLPASLQAEWLMGAKGANLDAKIELTISPLRSAFPQYDKYLFTEMFTTYPVSKKEVFKGTLDESGYARLDLEIPKATNAPGMLRANFTTRVYEPGGDFSIYSQEEKLSPYTSYVGMKIDDVHSAEDRLETDKPYSVEVLSLNESGQPLAKHKVNYAVYSIGWSWWYQREDLLANYVHNQSVKPLYKGSLLTNQSGKTQFELQVNYPEYGQYLVHVEDMESGHSVSQLYYIDWPSWRGRSEREEASGITHLPLTLNKASYEVGETIELTIPAVLNGRALVSIEAGDKILNYEWVELNKSGDTKYTFKATSEMTPTSYVNVSLLQPHNQTANNSPLRRYGVIPIRVEHRDAILEPVIEFPTTISPEKEYTLKISEQKGKAMTYTIAIVDDGLLDLTAFTTPNPYSYFYSKEALGINTWDMYDDVIGAKDYISKKMYRVGGDEMLKPGEAKTKRFKPVVLFEGPYTVEANQVSSHKIKLPMYVGSVRIMVVASTGSAFGAAEQTTQVKNPLMILSATPRIVSIQDEVWIPVNVFAMSDDVKNVAVQLTTTPNIEGLDGNKKTLQFIKQGDQTTYFKVRVGNKVGKAKLYFTAKSGSHIASEEVEIEVRNPNPQLTLSEERLVKPGEEIALNYDHSKYWTDKPLVMEVSKIPSIHLTNRLEDLVQYTHNSTEAAVSKGLAMLYITQLITLNKEQTAVTQRAVEEAIQKIYSRQNHSGGFINWNNTGFTDNEITAYCCLFLAKAKERGYQVNTHVLNQALGNITDKVKIWTESDSNYLFSNYIQALNLYVLAVANRADVAAMNRFSESENTSYQAKWILALAYATIGKKDLGAKLLFQNPKEGGQHSVSFESTSIQDEAFGLLTYLNLGQTREAFKQAISLARSINNETFYQPLSVAFAVFSLAEFTGQVQGDQLAFTYSLNNQKEEVQTIQTVTQRNWSSAKNKGTLKFKNESKDNCYVGLSQSVYVDVDNTPSIQNKGIQLNVNYLSLSGQQMNINQLKQGTDIIAQVTVRNVLPSTHLPDIAVTHIISSGWEIYQVDWRSDINSNSQNIGVLSHQESRDDRIMSYLSLKPGQSVTLTVRLHSTYAGQFVLPAVVAESLNTPEYRAKTLSRRVKVVH